MERLFVSRQYGIVRMDIWSYLCKALKWLLGYINKENMVSVFEAGTEVFWDNTQGMEGAALVRLPRIYERRRKGSWHIGCTEWKWEQGQRWAGFLDALLIGHRATLHGSSMVIQSLYVGCSYLEELTTSFTALSMYRRWKYNQNWEINTWICRRERGMLFKTK